MLRKASASIRASQGKKEQESTGEKRYFDLKLTYVLVKWPLWCFCVVWVLTKSSFAVGLTRRERATFRTVHSRRERKWRRTQSFGRATATAPSSVENRYCIFISVGLFKKHFFCGLKFSFCVLNMEWLFWWAARWLTRSAPYSQNEVTRIKTLIQVMQRHTNFIIEHTVFKIH